MLYKIIKNTKLANTEPLLHFPYRFTFLWSWGQLIIDKLYWLINTELRTNSNIHYTTHSLNEASLTHAFSLKRSSHPSLLPYMGMYFGNVVGDPLDRKWPNRTNVWKICASLHESWNRNALFNLNGECTRWILRLCYSAHTCEWSTHGHRYSFWTYK